MNKFVWLTVSWFGISGLFKSARGTWGTLAALPFAWVIQTTLGNTYLMILAWLLFALGIYASEKYVLATGKQDPNEVVVDEVAAVWMLLAFMMPNWQCYLVAFILFRIFDVLKPWPVSVADRKVHGGFGIMFDDVLAALYPIVLFSALAFVKPEWSQEILAWLQIP